MTTIFIIFVLMALLHLIYESILVPSLRLRFRFRMFALRDELRKLKAENEDVSNELFDYLQDSINIQIKFLHQLDIKTMLWAYKSVNDDELLHEEVESRWALIESCDREEIREIASEIYSSAAILFLINNGALFFYGLPVVLAILFYQRLKLILRNFLSIPTTAIKEVVPLDNRQVVFSK